MGVLEKEKVMVPELRFGEFGDEWQSQIFQNILLDSRLGGNYQNSENETSNPLIKMGNLDRGNIKLNKIEYIPESEEIKEIDRIKEGDLFFNTRNTLDLVGKVAIWRNELEKAYYNSNLMYIKFENNYFMNYCLNSYAGIKGLRRLATGTTSVAAIYTKDLLKLKLTTPTLPEQQKIASFLSAVDEKIQQLTAKKNLLEQYKKGVMQKLFSGKIRFKDENGNDFPDWEEKRLGEVGGIVSGLTYSPDDIGPEGVLVLRSSNVHRRRVTFTDNVFVNVVEGGYNPLQENDILICVRNGSKRLIGKNALINGDAVGVAFGAFMTVYRSESNLFLFHYFDTVLYKKEVHKNLGATINSINGSDLKKFNIPFPSFQEQQKIATYLSSLDTKIETVNKRITQTQTFKKGLLQQIFV